MHLMSNHKYSKVCFISAIPLSLVAFMKPHIKILSNNHQIQLVSNGKKTDVLELLDKNVSFKGLGIKRKISIFSDFSNLLKMWYLLRSNKTDIVHSITPKAGLLGMLAGYCSRTPVRIHWFTGQVWATKKGMSRTILKNIDRLTAMCATHLLVDSPSQRDFLIKEKVVKDVSKLTVLGYGSVCGVDLQIFKPSLKNKERIKNDLKIHKDAVLGLFLGRLNHDKGVIELAKAFKIAAGICPDFHLLIVGPDEANMKDTLDKVLFDVIDRVHYVGFTNDPQLYMSSADVFILPSYREGFGSSVIEAAACGLPSIGSNIYGLSDAIVNDVTGLLVPAKDISQLSKAMIRLVTDTDLRLKMGKQALERVKKHFDQKVLAELLSAYYSNLRNVEIKKDAT